MSYASILEPLRFEYDTYLFQDLTREPEIQACQARANQAEHFNLHQRHLLGTAVRITDLLFPQLYGIYQDCLGRIGSELSGNLYVYQACEYNAHVHAHGQRFDMVLTSAIVKDFKPAEIAFVIGHELGHVIFAHNTIPAGALLFNERGEGISASLAKRLFQWSRAAEISADRIGFLTCGDLCGAANAFFKLASGIQVADDDRVLRALHAQFDEIARLTGELGGNITYASTHPLIPIRFKSLELISLDLLALRNTGKSIRARDLQAINRQVQEVLVQTEPLNLQVQEAVRASEDFLVVLVLSLLYVALSDGPLRDAEEGFVREVVQRYQARLQLEAILGDCRGQPQAFRAEALAELDAAEVSRDEALQIVHTCTVLCGPQAGPAERQAMREIAEALGGQREWVENMLL